MPETEGMSTRAAIAAKRKALTRLGNMIIDEGSIPMVAQVKTSLSPWG